MASPLAGKTIAALMTDGFEQSEFTSPRDALNAAGASVRVVSLKPGHVRGWEHFDKGDTFVVDVTVAKASADDFDALLLPGGIANPDQLRTDAHSLAFVRGFIEAGKPIAAICHGPWTLIDANAVAGKRMTSYKSIRTDLENAGAEWVDEACVVDKGLVTSRDPKDLPEFNARMIEVFARGATDRPLHALGAELDQAATPAKVSTITPTAGPQRVSATV